MVRRERVGDEPSTARSAYGLRAWSAAVGLVVCGVGAALAAVAAPGSPHGSRWMLVAVVLGVLALVAAVDLVVVLRRMRDERRRLL